MILSIYKIENLNNGKIYIGCSSNARKRIRTHKNDLAKGNHPQKELQADYDNGNKFAACELFAVSVSDSFDPYIFGRAMHAVEAHYTIKYNSDVNGYNIKHVGAWRKREEATTCKPDLESIRAELRRHTADFMRWGWGVYRIRKLEIIYRQDSTATDFKPCNMEIYKGQPKLDTHGKPIYKTA